VSNRTINHELGHNLSLAHSNTGIDGDNYSSLDCVMANSASPHVDGPHSYQLGWYPDSNFGIKTYGQYEIENLAQPGSDLLKVLRFDRGAYGATSNANYDLWVEYRLKGVGHDDELSGSWDKQVNIHLSPPSSRRPGDNFNNILNNNVAHFINRGEYTDPNNLCTVRFVREDSTSASATVQLIDPNGNQPPAVQPSQNFYVGVGSSVFTVNASDPDNDALTYTIVSNPANGTLTNIGNTFTYKGSTLGAFEFTLRVNDGQYDSFDETFPLTVVGGTAPLVNAGSDETVTILAGNLWTPASIITGAWYDASDASSIAESSGSVSAWNDKSGNGRHLTPRSGSGQPTTGTQTFNSLNALSFNNSGATLQQSLDQTTDINLGQAFAVLQYDGPATSNRPTAIGGASANSHILQMVDNDVDGVPEGFNGGSPYINGATSTGGSPSDFSSLALMRRDMSWANYRMSAGGDRGINDRGHVGFIAEIVLFETALSQERRETMEGYLAHKWGVATELPATHPYKISAPGGTNVVVNLVGSASDPNGDTLTSTWSVLRGPATVAITDVTHINTTAAFTTSGAYVLRLTVTDGINTTSDDITINVIVENSPEISVFGNSVEIVSGDTTPSTSDETYFGTVNGAASVAKTFTISNFGSSDLVLSGSPRVSISGSSAFSVTAQPTSPIVTTTGTSPTLGTSDFVITFLPTNAEAQSATVSIASNDSDEPLYTFNIAGNRSSVDVSASDTLANEGGSDTGTWTFTRIGGGTASNLTVYYTLDGTATEAIDYNVSPSGQVVIPAGQSSATVTLTPIVDGDIEGSETAILTITDNGAYTVGDREDTITINEPDQILISSPNGVATYATLTTQTVDWISAAGGNVKIDLLKGGTFHSEIVASTPNNGSYDWTISGNLPAGNDYRVRVSLLPGVAVTDTSDADFSIILDPLAEAVDTPQLSWTNIGDADWFAQTTSTHDGVDAAESGDIDDNQNSIMETTFTGPGTLTFWWKVSSQSGYDSLRFSINNVEQAGTLAPISGEVDWVKKEVTIPAGNNTVKWAYVKDQSVSLGDDTAWVDQVTFTPDTVTYTVTYSGNGSDGGTVPVDGNAYSLTDSVTILGNTGSLTKSGFSFIGWNTAANGSGVSYSAAGTFSITEDVTLQAQWAETFANWGGGVAFGDDANNDGVANGMAWLLGAANKNANAINMLPLASVDGAGSSIVLNFTCLNLANRGGATLKVQSSDDLGITDAWTDDESVVPDTSGVVNGMSFVTSPHTNPALINVQVTVPSGGSSRIFLRLMGEP